MRQVSMVLLLLAFALSVRAAETPDNSVPEMAASAQAIREAFRDCAGFGYVQSAHFNRYGQEIMLLWYCPFSGRAACYLHGYYYDPQEKIWKRFLDDFVEGSYDLSVSMPAAQESVIVQDVSGQEVRRIDVSMFPRRECPEQEQAAGQDAGARTEDGSSRP